jgi:lipopolysaccharide/colanic/teichoic acid biosynthesis glycosyltransferase
MEGNVLKRSLDLVVGSILLVVSLPVLAFAALWIKIETGDPALFRQMRMGKGFRPFSILKLRTMRMGKGGPSYTFGRDPRITRVGYWLRRFKIDELPQLWNVVKGEMSLVGPRPVIPELTEEFREEYNELLRVRPGLTDPATVKYSHESEMLAGKPDPLRVFKQVVTPDKIRISMAYQQRATVWSDLVLMARTLGVVIGSVRGPAPVCSAQILVFRPQTSIEFRSRRLEPLPLLIGANCRKDVREEEAVALAMVSGKRTGSGDWV